jgi:YegS/Rv2252/BmrU family lipid kinase
VTKRALLIRNPAARGAPPVAKLRAALDMLDGWETSLQDSEGAGHATVLATSAAQRGLDAVVACGGDGTVNEVANGLAGSHTALGVVRGGTANVWAKETGVPKDPAKALRLLAEGEVRAVDLGHASAVGGSASGGNERYFLLMAGVGFDAEIVRGVSSAWKRRLGAAAYLGHGLRVALRHRAAEAELATDGESSAGPLYWLLVANCRNYAGLLDIALHAQVDDGLLDVCLLRKGGLARLAWLLPWVLLRRHDRRAHVEYRQARSLDIATPGLPVQVDGEYLDETPLRFEVTPGALRVIVAPGLKKPLFRASA